MQSARILQAVVLLLIVALAASCAATKEYASKIFPGNTEVKDSQAVALRFLELDKLDPDQENWVSTDIIMGRDTNSKTTALDKLSEVFPSTGAKRPADSILVEKADANPVYVNTVPPTSDKTEAIKKNKKDTDVNKNSSASVNKAVTTKEDKTSKTTPVIVTEKKTEPVVDLPVARTYNNGDVREKKTRDEQ